ncbi:N-acetylneuraminate synthase family protein [Streptomyces sp. NBC_01020]|uniref:N-acetylneuraminate synthase family protein n=1 Tax=unclassified Streptomyces TaxID=2593676 RepID=UPI002251CDB4|nr:MULTISPECIES: N-acetylneuraminate synthase family protein [unclassified Streptomyces]MCX4723184.1 N-acetylneuraminate synthase family protein [Streptomyces sp. NBC_01306]WSV07193.1 N-acetylneuraminate synthase family protein [Streptomyces sp. NBC_01020]WSX45308.1 N-acetylneuraminate synthase family protein [Streptomyces sp. NBC_00963]WSX66669.1 N-acetylneuraminate synthase family protein [Streptomyces sp. NBC_00932]
MARSITIGNSTITDSTDAYVIAEIGHNHGGDLGLAEELVRMAAKSGAHAAKLQKRNNKALFTKAMYNSPYTGRNSYGATYGEHREAVEFGEKEYRHLAGVAAETGIAFFSTAFDFESVDFLAELGMPAIKMASGDLTNTPLLAYAAKTGIPLVISTGGAAMEDVRRAVDTVLPLNSQLAVLQCTAAYPATPDVLNLSVISTFREEFPDVVVGLSGHDVETESSVIAYALGARVVEKHVTLDRTMPGSDHHFSLEADHLRVLVDGLERTRRSLGDPVKQVLPVEQPALHKMAKKLVAARDLRAGETLTTDSIAIKSPGDGLRPYLLGELVGRTLLEPLAADDSIQLSNLG